MLSIYFNYERATKTHCGVKNFLPSISTSIGDFYPQVIIWRLCIALHAFPRYFISSVHYKNYYLTNCLNFIIDKSSFKALIKLSFVFNYIEITCLLLLTYVSSSENHKLHALFFCLFLITSTLYMILICLSYFYKTHQEPIRSQIRSRNLKFFLLFLYLSSFLTSLYFYIRHNTYCEANMFSYFSFCEYITVFTNIAFHSIIFLDLDMSKKMHKIRMISIENEKKKFP